MGLALWFIGGQRLGESNPLDLLLRFRQKERLAANGGFWPGDEDHQIMADYKLGDIVVLTAGSMRMAVEAVEGDKISTVWCNEGAIGRDTFASVLLKKWEAREDDRGGRGGKPFRGDREGGGKPYGDKPRDKPQGKPGWDGKPREKKFFRKD